MSSTASFDDLIESPDFHTPIEHLKLCSKLPQPLAIQLLQKLSDQLFALPENFKGQASPSDWISKYVLPFVRFCKRNLDLALFMDASICQALWVKSMKMFITTVLRTIETSAFPYEITHFGCSCSVCNVLRRFFTLGDKPKTFVKPHADSHVEQAVAKLNPLCITRTSQGAPTGQIQVQILFFSFACLMLIRFSGDQARRPSL